ncbi:MAG: glycosyltransferase [Victivallales bacterium]|nr:glycosyltransferase [Victivallales bacterium]
MDVLHITEACGAGVRRHLGLILPALQARGLKCGLFAFGSRFESGFVDEFSGLECFQCQVDASPRSVSLLKAVSRIRRLCRELKPQVIHCHAFAAGVAGRLAAPPDVKIIYSPHAFSVNRHVTFPRRLFANIAERALRGRTDGYILVGPGELEDAKALGIQGDRICLAFNGLPESIGAELLPRNAARSALGLSNDEKAVIAPCRLEQQKGLDQLLLMWRELQGIRLHVFGDGPKRREL